MKNVIKNKIQILFATAFIALLSFSCKKDTIEDKFPPINLCDTSNVSFKNHIQPILDNNCNNCHAQNSQIGAGIILSNYDGVKQQIDNNRLLGSILHLQGFSNMPKGGGKLSNCQIKQIEVWIENGSENN